MYNHQIKVIESHSNITVNYMMVEASVIEREQKVLEHDLMIRIGKYLNDKLAMEMTNHTKLRDQKTKIRELQQRVIPEKNYIRKQSDDSVGTSETFDEFGSIAYQPSECQVNNPWSSFTRLLTLH